MDHVLPDLEVLSLQVTLKSQDSGWLPGFLHSTLRGAFGHALKRVAGEVDELGSSPYERIFEGKPFRPQQNVDPSLGTPPPPFIIRCGVNGDFSDLRTQNIDKGTLLIFTFTLFGFACDELQAVALAIEDMAEAGLGEQRIPFQLQLITCLTPSGPELLNLSADCRPQGLSLRLLESLPSQIGLNITIITPISIRFKKGIIIRPNCEEFIGAACRRIRTLCEFYSDSATDICDVAELIDSWTWKDGEPVSFTRISNRQRKNLMLAGTVGRIALTSRKPRVVQPVILALSVLGIGHNTTQGLGQYSVTRFETLLSLFGVGNYLK